MTVMSMHNCFLMPQTPIQWAMFILSAELKRSGG